MNRESQARGLTGVDEPRVAPAANPIHESNSKRTKEK